MIERVGGPRLPVHTEQPLLSHIDLFAEHSCAASGGEGQSEAQPLSPAQPLVRSAPMGEPVNEGSVDLWGLMLPSPDPRRSFPSVPESGAQAGSDLVRLFLMTSSTNKEFPVFQVRALKGFPNSCCP